LQQWLTIWQVWLADKNRLAVYRIMLGESHKMQQSSVDLFKQLQGVFDKALDSLLAGLAKPLSPAQIYVLKATSKEALLMPQLYARPASTQELALSAELKALLNGLLSQD
jgi:hypothetical protein